MIKSTEVILNQIKSKLLSEETALKYKVSPKDFTRSRKLPFANTLVFMLNFLCRSLTVEIDIFISFINNKVGLSNVVSFTKSAFILCRKKIQPEVFKYLSDSIVEEFYTDNDEAVKLWNGLRLLAVDGSKVTLPNTTKLADFYGTTKNQHNTVLVQGIASVLYDVLNKYAIDGSLNPISFSEGRLALEHLNHATKGDLVIYDRGYPSFELMYHHYDKGVDFLMRAKISFNTATRNFYQSGLKTDTVRIFANAKMKLSDKLYSKDSYVEVRLLRVELENGDIEILITSLTDNDKYSSKLFKELYFLRWGVETYYDELKNKIKLEYFSGYSLHSIQQDFHAILFISNIQSLIVREINEQLEQKRHKTKYQYKVNTNLSYGFLKNRIIELFFSHNDMEVIIQEIKDLYIVNTVPIRNNRSFKRNKDKYRRRRKPKVPKNNRDAI